MRLPCHMAAFFSGFLLDLLLGDPAWMPHPVRLIGAWVSRLETFFFRAMGRAGARAGDALGNESSRAGDDLGGESFRAGEAVGDGAAWSGDASGDGAGRAGDAVGNGAFRSVDAFGNEASRSEDGMDDRAARAGEAVGDGAARAGDAVGGEERKGRAEFFCGVLLAILVLAASVGLSAVILLVAYGVHPLLGMAAETWMTYQILAVKSLRVESMDVCHALEAGDVEGARAAVSRIVGRDTDSLGEDGIARAAVESVAENTTDGVIAPMLYLAVGGPVLGFFHKAASTMDSMIGYRNEKYRFFGKAAARLDDILNFIPARASALLMILAASIGGKDVSGRGACAVYKRDRKNHASPNSAQTEAACAGALGVRLAGGAAYGGKYVEKPYIGDDFRRICAEDIRRANRLMYLTAWEGELICLAAMCLAA